MSKILIVEDEAVIREPFALVLQLNKYTVDSAGDGQEALKLCQKTDYDIILLDLMMPVLDGVGFLKEFRSTKPDSKTRIVILSNLSSGEMVNEAARLGVDRQEVKANLSPQDLVDLVKAELSAQGAVKT